MTIFGSPPGFAWRSVAVAATAALFGLSFPPWGSPLVAWFALVPFLVALRGLKPAVAIGLSWLSGLAMAYAITDFLPGAVAVYYGQGYLFGALLFIGSVSVMCCVSHILFALWYRSSLRPSGVAGPLFVGAAWVSAEFLRGDVAGNPWGTIGYSQVAWLPIVQMAEWTGVYGVSFVVVSFNAAAAELVAALLEKRSLAAPRRSLALVSVLGVAAFAYGAARIPAVEAQSAGSVPIAVVQGNDDLGSRWQREFYGRNLEAYLRQTAAAATKEPAAMVFWPENAMTFFLADEPLYRYAISQVLSLHGLQLLAGAPYREGGRIHNSAFVLAPDGSILARYDKRVLMPFAEYYPRWLALFRRRTFDEAQEFTAGTPLPPPVTLAGPAAVVTCNEALFPRTVAERVAEGGGYIVNLANDGWLGVYRYSDRVLDFIALRAVEQRRFVVRASSSGGSAVFAPSGRAIATSRPFEAEVLRASIASSNARTPYGRMGDVFAALCAIAVGGAALRSRRT